MENTVDNSFEKIEKEKDCVCGGKTKYVGTNCHNYGDRDNYKCPDCGKINSFKK